MGKRVKWILALLLCAAPLGAQETHEIGVGIVDAAIELLHEPDQMRRVHRSTST